MVTKLTEVRIKDIWKTEDKDFTPWLVDNINLLIQLEKAFSIHIKNIKI